jgi:hypothetical protein
MPSAEDNLEAAYQAWNSQKLAITNQVQEYDQQLQLKQTHDLDGAFRAVYANEMDKVKYLLDKQHVPYVELDTAIPNWPDPFSKTIPVQSFTIPVGSVRFHSPWQQLFWYITPNSIPTVNGYGMCVVSIDYPKPPCCKPKRTPAGYVNEFSDYPFSPVDRNLPPPYPSPEYPPFNWKGKPADVNDPEFQAYLHQQFTTSVSGPVTDQGLYDIYGVNFDSLGRSRVNPAVPGSTPEQVGENEIITPIRINQKHRNRFTFTAQKMWQVIALFSPRQQIVVYDTRCS